MNADAHGRHGTDSPTTTEQIGRMMGNYNGRGGRQYRGAEILDMLHDEARRGDARMSLLGAAESIVTYFDGAVDYSGDVLVYIPNTCGPTFGNGTTIDRANREAIDQGQIPLNGYIDDEALVFSGPYCLNLSEVLRNGEHVDTDDLLDFERTLTAMLDYPVIDDEIVSALEMSDAVDAFDEWEGRNLGLLTDDESLTDQGAALGALIHAGAIDWEHDGWDVIYTLNVSPEDARTIVAPWITED